MKLPSYSRIAIEELPADVRKWASIIIDPVNSFMLSLKSGLNKGLTINENMAGALKTVTVVGGVTEFSYTSSMQPQAVIIGRVTDETAPSEQPTTGVGISWSYTGTTIACTFYGLTAGHKYNITLVIFDN